MNIISNTADETINVIATIRAKSGHEDEVRSSFQSMVEPTRREAGCVSYQLLEDKYYTGSFFIFEEWQSEQHLAEHLERIKAGLDKAKEWLQEDVRICIVKPVI